MSINQGLEKLNDEWSPARVGETVDGLIRDIAPKRGEDSDDAWGRARAIKKLQEAATRFSDGWAIAGLRLELGTARIRIADLERQRDNLQRANNAELERRRDAEAENARLRAAVERLVEAGERVRHRPSLVADWVAAVAAAREAVKP